MAAWYPWFSEITFPQHTSTFLSVVFIPLWFQTGIKSLNLLNNLRLDFSGHLAEDQFIMKYNAAELGHYKMEMCLNVFMTIL